MKYETPKIRTLEISEVLSLLGPARALIYVGGGSEDEGSDI